MGRLIDADKLIKFYTEHLKETSSGFMWTLGAVLSVSAQPTAYDVNKVTERLKEKAESHGGEDYYVEIGDAIEIVKAGGTQ